MNLNKKLKTELVTSVLRDQLGGEIEQIKKDLIAETSKLSESLHGEASRNILKTAIDAGMEHEIGVRNTANLRGKNVASLIFRVDKNSVEYKIEDRVDLSFKVVAQYSYMLSANSEIEALYKKALKINHDWNTIKDDLFAVLNSVRTVKKLQELTKVFDPFIPSEIKGTQLVPTEPLLRINELKTPKK